MSECITFIRHCTVLHAVNRGFSIHFIVRVYRYLANMMETNNCVRDNNKMR